MKTKEILKEILENNEDLKKDEKKIKKIIESLLESNPDIKIDQDFKKKLKDKLETIIQLNKDSEKTREKKILFYSWLVPWFSLFFLVASFYYYLWWTTFFIWEKNIEIPKNSEIINNETINEKIKNTENSNTKKDNKIEKTPINENSNEDTQKNDISNNNIPKNDEPSINLSNENTSRINIEPKKEIEDNQIIDLLWEAEWDNLWWGYIATESYSLKSIAPVMWDGLYQCDTEITSNDYVDNCEIESNTWITETNTWTLDFTTYCNNNFWEIIRLEWENICITNEERCFESEYNNWSCTFVEIK